MSSLPKCRRVKRPTILAKRSQLAKTNIYKKRSYKPLYEKLKTNNNALAKALSKEKQEYQYLFSQNIALTSEVQELGVACNKRDDIISGVLKNAKESLQLLITLSGHVTNTIASCQQVVSTTRYTPRKSTSAIERRESNRRLSGKSPARGVVQPMVSGHMITKPTINLSRLNIEREYRVQNPSNLSDIEETLTTPEQSPSTTESTTPVRISITRPLNFGTRRVDRIPERLQTSIRTSDENERSSGGRGSRNSSRRSITLYRSRKNSPRNSSVAAPQKNNLNVTPETQDDERLRSPRVALHDVSRLLQNSQSVNIRTLLSNSSDMDLTQSQQSEALNYDESQQSPEVEDILANVDNTRSKIDKNVDNTRSKIDKNVDTTRSKIDSTSQSPTNNIRSKNTSTIPSDDDDPLEGPSWLLNDAEAVLPAVDNVNSSTRLINARNNKYIEKSNRHHEKLRSDLISDDEDDNDDDDEQTVNLATRFPNHQSNFYPNDDDGTKSLLPSFVTRKRGSNCDNTDDFTLMWRPATKNYDYDENELEFPVLESPLLPAEDINPPPREPDVTTNVQIITTQNFGNITTQRRPNELDSSLDMSDVDAEILAGDLKVRNSVVVQDERSGHENDDDDDDDDFPPRKRKRNDKKKVRLDSASDSEWAPTPKRKNLKIKGKTSLKDPSSAKVVLQKLRDDHGKIRYLSSDIKLSLEIDNHRSGIMQREPSSDSEVSSNGSSNKFTASTEVHRRPRRQKAPKNLQEPSLGKKLRRN